MNKRLEILTEAIETGESASENLEKYLKAPFKVQPAPTPRYINRFLLGADPEFNIFVGDRRTTAANFNLKTGTPFGADNNDRLVEIRPRPSKSALQVVANLLRTLRWLNVYCYHVQPGVMINAATNVRWDTFPFEGEDGVGGHVHFGRRRLISQPDEVQALDHLMPILCEVGVFSKTGCESRARNTHYGHTGDIRSQTYGYEYRTFPSWLDSPWLAYFVLTLSKLNVVNPKLGLARRLKFDSYGRNAQNAILALLAYFRGLDDDARLCIYLIKKYGVPRFIGGDFRSRWGLNGPAKFWDSCKKTKIQHLVLPVLFPEATEEREEIFWHLVGGKILEPKVPSVDWSPSTLQDGFLWLHQSTKTYAEPGLGELAARLAISELLPVGLFRDTGSNDAHSPILISSALVKAMPKDFPSVFQKYNFTFRVSMNRDEFSEHIRIWTTRGHRNTPETWTRLLRLLTSGVFPIWKVGDESAEKLKPFLERFRSAPIVKKKSKLNMSAWDKHAREVTV